MRLGNNPKLCVGDGARQRIGFRSLFLVGTRMTKRSAERAVGELLDSFQAVLHEVEERNGLTDDSSEPLDLSEEDWLLRDSSIARIDAACHVLELLNYAALRNVDGKWYIRRE